MVAAALVLVARLGLTAGLAHLRLQVSAGRRTAADSAPNTVTPGAC